MMVRQIKNIAVTIGIDAYPRHPLRSAVLDARRMAGVLQRLGYQTFEFHDRYATGKRLRTLFRDRLPRLLGPNDRLVVFFAGHGITDKPNQRDAMGYLIPVDGSMSDPRAVHKTGLSMASVTDWLSGRKIKARQVLLLIDACYSGLALPEGKYRAPIPGNLAWAARMPVTMILTAGSEGQRAVEDASGGLFTKALVRALGSPSADQNRDGLLTTSELEDYMVPRVRKQAARKRHAQHPQVARIGSGELVFALKGAAIPGYEMGSKLDDMVLVRVGRSRKKRRRRRRTTSPALLMDATEVTVRQFKRCVADGVCSAKGLERSPLCTFGRAGSEEHPVNCVTFEQARAFCRWRRKRLPTELEWLSTARVRGTRHPWGDQAVSCVRSIMYDAGGRGCGAMRTSPVASRPLGRSPHGLYDLIGNVREWTIPGDPKRPANHVPRAYDLIPVYGGAWHQGAAGQTVKNVVHLLASDADEFTGFRCAANQ